MTTLIQVNAGGNLFTTHIDTLRKIPYFKALERINGKINDNIFIDINPEAFSIVLDICRHGKNRIPAKYRAAIRFLGFETEDLTTNSNENQNQDKVPKTITAITNVTHPGDQSNCKIWMDGNTSLYHTGQAMVQMYHQISLIPSWMDTPSLDIPWNKECLIKLKNSEAKSFIDFVALKLPKNMDLTKLYIAYKIVHNPSEPYELSQTYTWKHRADLLVAFSREKKMLFHRNQIVILFFPLPSHHAFFNHASIFIQLITEKPTTTSLPILYIRRMSVTDSRVTDSRSHPNSGLPDYLFVAQSKLGNYHSETKTYHVKFSGEDFNEIIDMIFFRTYSKYPPDQIALIRRDHVTNEESIMYVPRDIFSSVNPIYHFGVFESNGWGFIPFVHVTGQKILFVKATSKTITGLRVDKTHDLEIVVPGPPNIQVEIFSIGYRPCRQ